MTTLVTAVPVRDYPGHVPTGPVARPLAARLLAAGEPVRVLAPPDEAAGWPAGAEVVPGDIARPGETPEAFAGVDRMFLAGAVPATVREAVTLARRGGVRRIAVLSSHGPEVEIEFEPEAWYWLAIEVVVERSGAEWTHLRPSPLMAQTLRDDFPEEHSGVASAIRNGAVIREAYPDSAYPLLDEDDLAAIAATALTGDGPAHQTLTVHGAPLSLRERLRLTGRALGREIPFEELTPRQAADRARERGASEEEVEEWLAGEAEWAADATDASAPRDPAYETATRVLGRPPRGYADWLADHVDAFR